MVPLACAELFLLDSDPHLAVLIRQQRQAPISLLLYIDVATTPRTHRHEGQVRAAAVVPLACAELFLLNSDAHLSGLWS